MFYSEYRENLLYVVVLLISNNLSQKDSIDTDRYKYIKISS